MDSLILDATIGLVFVFAIFAFLTSLLTETISNFLGLRGEYLLRGIRSLVDSKSEFKLRWRDFLKHKSEPPPAYGPGKGPLTPKIVQTSYISVNASNSTMPPGAGDARLTNRARRQLPSYLSGRSFARAVVDIVVPDNEGQTTLNDFMAGVVKLPDGPLKAYLTTLIDETAGDLSSIRRGIEEWYDDHMARVSGWYKRHVRWITLVIGIVLVLVFNVNAVEITRSLYTDDALRGSVVTQAVAAAKCEDKDPQVCLQDVRDQISTARAAGLPFGWGMVPGCENKTCSFSESVGLADPAKDGWADLTYILILLCGWIIMVLSLLPGSRFWFDLLAKFGSLRSTGPKPHSTA